MKIKVNKRLIFPMLILFSFQLNGMIPRKKVTLNWNHTNKELPNFVHDSIQNFYKSLDKEGLFFIYGEGINEDKNNIDGIYSCCFFSSHSRPHILIIFQNRICIIRGYDFEDIISEISRFVNNYGIDHNFFKQICLNCFEYLVDEYEPNWLQCKENPKVQNGNRTDVINYLWQNVNEEAVLKKYQKIKDSKDIDIIIKNLLDLELNTEEKILLLGLIGGKVGQGRSLYQQVLPHNPM